MSGQKKGGGMAMLIAVQGLRLARVGALSGPVARVLAVLQCHGSALAEAELMAALAQSRGAAAKAIRQALAAGVIEPCPLAELPMAARTLEPATPPDPAPPMATLGESPFSLPRRQESDPAPATPRDPGPTSLKEDLRKEGGGPEYPPPGTPGESPVRHIVAPGDPASSNNVRQAWQRAQAALALQLTTSEYDALVGPCRFMAYEAGELTLMVPNSVSRDLMGNRLRPWLKEHLAQLLGEYVDIHILLDESAAPEVPPDTPADLKTEMVKAGIYPLLAARYAAAGPLQAIRAELTRFRDDVRSGALLHVQDPGAVLAWRISQAIQHSTEGGEQ